MSLSNPARMHRGADAGLAVCMLVLDGLGVLLTFLMMVGTGLDEALDPSGTPDSDASAGEIALIGLGLIAAFAVVSCALLLRNQARIAGTLQGAVACVAVLVALGGLASERSEAGLDPAPTEDTSDTYTGPGGQCRSGGDNSECEGTAG